MSLPTRVARAAALVSILLATPALAENKKVVLSQAFWKSAFASDPAVIGRTVRLGGDGFEVIGVVVGDFHGLDQGFLRDSVWIPLAAVSSPTDRFGVDWHTIKTERSPTVSALASACCAPPAPAYRIVGPAHDGGATP